MPPPICAPPQRPRLVHHKADSARGISFNPANNVVKLVNEKPEKLITTVNCVYLSYYKLIIKYLLYG